MDVSPLSRKINTATMPLDKLAASSQLSEKEKIGEISRHFEAILLRQFLNEAHKPIFDSKSSINGASREIYQDMMVSQLADEISKSGKFGLATSFQAQMLPKNESSAENVSNAQQGDKQIPSK